MSQRTSLFLYRTGWSLVQWLPERIAYLTFSALAQLSWLSQSRGVRRLERNLARVQPDASIAEVKRLARKGMHSYMRYWCDAFRLPIWDKDRVLDTFRLEDLGGMTAALDDGRGAVMALSHSGNWDHAGAAMCQLGYPVTTVAERLKPEELYQEFVKFREELGMTIYPTRGESVFQPLVRTLKSGGFVPLLMDRDMSSHGVPVNFFGEVVRMAPGPAALSRITGAPLYPAMIYYERLGAGAKARWGTVLRIYPAIGLPRNPDAPTQVQEMTQACADALARGISEFPQDWHMLQPIFPSHLMNPEA